MESLFIFFFTGNSRGAKLGMKIGSTQIQEQKSKKFSQKKEEKPDPTTVWV